MESSMYKLRLGEHEYSLTTQDIEQLDLIPLDRDHYHLINGGRNLDVSFHFSTEIDNHVKVIIEDVSYEFEVLDELDQLIDSMGMSKAGISYDQNINAPMPGLVLDIMVGEGDQVEAGTPLLILEAMKMENMIKASSNGVIESINCTVKQAVDKGQLLIKMKEADA